MRQDQTTPCMFFGKVARFPAGTMWLANILKVPVILFFGLYRGGNRYEVHFELFAERVTIDRRHRDEEVQQWTQRYADRLEHHCRLAADNWFNFYDFWEEQQ
jgi:predicted LPLAT superfamily acyltransferase